VFVFKTQFRFVFKTFAVELRHRLLLRDSHAALLRDPSFVTNKTDAFQGVIDYIW
jgi:mRNA deadenylase 3'-5' endonuclease subunit Ccr4